MKIMKEGVLLQEGKGDPKETHIHTPTPHPVLDNAGGGGLVIHRTGLWLVSLIPGEAGWVV